MNLLPLAVHTAAQNRALDRHAIEVLGIASYTLMMRAGAAAYSALREGWPRARRILVVCGPGNNGGDGYVLARLAHQAGLAVLASATSDPQQLKGDARRAMEEFVQAGGKLEAWTLEHVRGVDLVVDAIFGTGLSRPLDGRAASQVNAINACGAPVLSLDIPSGLHADTGEALGAAIIAERTVTFMGLKLGFYTGVGQDHTGTVLFDALDVPADALSCVAPAAVRISEEEVRAALPRRPRTAHKGANGRVLVLGGGRGMPGAARMAGEAALRVGAGLVTIATRPENVAAIAGMRPELICRAVERPDELTSLIERADVLAVGPGLGQDEWARAMFDAAVGSDKAMVLDADGLNLLAQRPSANARWVLTPHPGEAARLLGSTVAQVQADRLGAGRALIARYQATVVLKGAGTLVASEASLPAICDRGNPGMASAGMGDVLTGVIAGLIAQGVDSQAAARVGVLVHAMAGDKAARRGERGLIASDLFEHLQSCVNPI
ncbi:MAG TPA: NAD(P)H-hydrate dehydratase [Steroidobacter sp.]|jgi:NAD(P)H-hydrate epimerase|nr:NAD(P)H-hydrate dehydratase [Steroidobacter sp.]